jgi:putative membrane protein
MEKKWKKLLKASVLFAGVGIAAPAMGQSLSAQPAGVMPADYNFVMQAALGGLGEITAGQIAQQRSTDTAVRDIGARLVADHTRANQELATLASARGITVPTTTDPGRQGAVAILQQMSGPAFAKAFVDQQLAEHQVAIALFQSEAASSMDTELRGFAQRQIPVLQHHLESILSVANVVSAR